MEIFYIIVYIFIFSLSVLSLVRSMIPIPSLYSTELNLKTFPTLVFLCCVFCVDSSAGAWTNPSHPSVAPGHHLLWADSLCKLPRVPAHSLLLPTFSHTDVQSFCFYVFLENGVLRCIQLQFPRKVLCCVLHLLIQLTEHCSKDLPIVIWVYTHFIFKIPNTSLNFPPLILIQLITFYFFIFI